MDVDAYRELQLLTEISASDSVTQRRLAQKHGLALGLTNFLIRRLVKKGYVKIVNLERKRLRYLITPKGIAEKARLTYEYVEYSLHLYRQIRTLVTRTISTMAVSAGASVVLYGTGEIAEIAFLLMQQRGLRVVGVVDESRSDQSLFMSHAITPPEALERLSFDWVLIASFKNHRQIIQQLCRWGVPEQKIVRIAEEQQVPSLPEAMVEVSSS
ncbi:MAG: winged helix-turn-helix transcriptional regulator [Candidatus Omnitrophica bacterium]|nr:winged helix-turn-helix transcriptional regulator [Candidatus Omnitrophota bacterium]